MYLKLCQVLTFIGKGWGEDLVSSFHLFLHILLIYFWFQKGRPSEPRGAKILSFDQDPLKEVKAIGGSLGQKIHVWFI